MWTYDIYLLTYLQCNSYKKWSRIVYTALGQWTSTTVTSLSYNHESADVRGGSSKHEVSWQSSLVSVKSSEFHLTLSVQLQEQHLAFKLQHPL